MRLTDTKRSKSPPQIIQMVQQSTLSHVFGDISSLITRHKFNGHNYLQWSQSSLMFIHDRGKQEHIDGCATQLDASNAKDKTWRAENNQVMSR